MERIFVFLGLILVVKSQYVGTCLETAAMNSHCCNYTVSEENKAIADECLRENHESHPCYVSCYADKKGFLMSNGTIDNNLLKQSIEKDFENYTGVYDIVEENCLNNDVTTYRQEEHCYLNEIVDCIKFTVMANCPEWIKTDECMNVKDLLQGCIQVFY